TEVRRHALPAAPRGRVWDQPAQAVPSGGNPLRQAGRALRSHHPHRGHRHLAPPPRQELSKQLLDGGRSDQDGEHGDRQPGPAAAGPTGARPWLYIGMLHEQRVLIDPVATHGLGLTGPGAAAVARSLASSLLDMDDGDVLVVAADTV